MDVTITTIGGFRIIAVPPTLHGGLEKKFVKTYNSNTCLHFLALCLLTYRQS